MKPCSKCLKEKPNSEFYASKRAVCKDCKKTQTATWRMANPNKAREAVNRWLEKPENKQRNKELMRSWYLRNRDRVRSAAHRNHLRRTYNLALEQFESILMAQQGKCALCLLPFDDTNKPFVDHDHACCPGNTSCGNCIRGLIHSRCNKVLGMAGDSVDILERAIAYLRDKGKSSIAA